MLHALEHSVSIAIFAAGADQHPDLARPHSHGQLV